MEARIARLESDVSHLRSDVSDIKVDLRALRDKIDSVDTRLSAKIEGLTQQVGIKFEAFNHSIARAQVWALSLYLALAAVNLGTLARELGWI